MTPLEAYQEFNSLKSHFTTKYDYFKYNGKVRLSKAIVQYGFKTDKHYWAYAKLSKHPEPQKYIIANLVDGNVRWIGDLNHKNYISWLKRQDSLRYLFECDLKTLIPHFDDNVLVAPNELPFLLKQYNRGDVMIETLIILNSLMGFFDYWDRKIEAKMVWQDLRFKCDKYKPFLRFDNAQYIEIVKKNFM